ncbi:sensor domain-containing protein [Halorubrum sp. RMP-47]|uniref:Sensor domain-containing protein n=1 Tax=Halorubrum miltondacostae TaxID=3076378 RepID=A0ABD5M3U1_9EURY
MGVDQPWHDEPTASVGDSLGGFIGVLGSGRPHRLDHPVVDDNRAITVQAMVYFVAFTTVSSLGVGLAFTIVGIPILIGTLIATTGTARLEARLAEELLGRQTAYPRPLRQSLNTDDEYVVALRRFLAEPTTWISVAVVLLKFLYELAAFVVTVVGSVLVVTMLAAPVVYDDPQVSYRIGKFVVSTLPEALAVAGLGVVGFWVICNVYNALATAGGIITDALLSVGREAAP